MRKTPPDTGQIEDKPRSQVWLYICTDAVTTQLPGIYKEAKQRAGQQLWLRAADGSSSVRATASWNWDRNGELQGKAVRANSEHILLQGTTFFFSFFPRGWLKYETIPNRYVATDGNLNRDPNLKWHYSSPCLHSLEMATASPLHVLPAPRQCLSSLLSHHQLLPPALLAFNVFFDLVSLSLLSSCQPPARSPARRIQSLQTIATAVTTKKTTVSSFPKG